MFPPPPPARYITTISCQNDCICQVVGQDKRLMLASKYVSTLYKSGRWGMRCEWSRCRYVTSLKPMGAARPPTESLLHFIKHSFLSVATGKRGKALPVSSWAKRDRHLLGIGGTASRIFSTVTRWSRQAYVPTPEPVSNMGQIRKHLPRCFSP